MNAMTKSMTDPAKVARFDRAMEIIAKVMVALPDAPDAWMIFDRIERERADELAKSASPLDWARNRVAEQKRQLGVMK